MVRFRVKLDRARKSKDAISDRSPQTSGWCFPGRRSDSIVQIALLVACGTMASNRSLVGDDKQTVIKISKKTTAITEPLDSQGFVDYLAAIDRIQRKGIAPDDNAAVYLARATGMRELSNSPDRGKYFEALGMQPIAVDGKSVPWLAFAAKFPETAQLGPGLLTERWSEGMSRPWTAEDDVALAKWLEANDEAIELMVRASKCSRYYAPLIGNDNADGPQLVLVLLPLVQEVRHVARMLSFRAMYRLGNDDLQGAFEDSLAIHRLSRLTSQGATLIDLLVGIACDSVACGVDVRIARHPKLRTPQALRFRRQLDKLTPFESIATKFDVAERWTMLDTVSSIARDGAKTLNIVMELHDFGPGADLLLKFVIRMGVDWNQVLRTSNVMYDRVTAAQRKPTRAQRMRELNGLQREIDAMHAKAASKKNLAFAFISKKHRSEWLSSVLVGSMLPGMSLISNAADRAAVKVDQTRLAFALAAYGAEHQGYPKSLDQLIPKYIAKLPSDRFGAGPFRYKATDKGYVLYSIGMNEKDDGGIDRILERHANDDIVVSVPPLH